MYLTNQCKLDALNIFFETFYEKSDVLVRLSCANEDYIIQWVVDVSLLFTENH